MQSKQWKTCSEGHVGCKILLLRSKLVRQPVDQDHTKWKAWELCWSSDLGKGTRDADNTSESHF